MWNHWYIPVEYESDEPLLQLMSHRRLIPSFHDIGLRRQIVDNLQLIVKQWIKDVGVRNNIKEINAEVIPYGSYALEVYSRTSDMDLLVIAPEVASMQYDFFQQLRKHIETIPVVNNVRAIERAKVPLIKFAVQGIEVDVACARLKIFKVPRPENLHKEKFCIPSAADSQSRTTLESIMSNWFILEAVGPNREIFVQATRLLKCWATCRGIYGNLNCYLGGVHLTIMIAYAAMIYKGGTTTTAPAFLNLRVLKPGTNEFCPSNVTKSTLLKIEEELWRGYHLTQDSSWKWGLLLEQFPYDAAYQRFLKVRISVLEGELDGWMGFVRSRLAFLIRSLEEDKVNCDPMLTEYVDLPPTGSQAKIRVFLWGIVKDTGEKYDLTGAENKWRQNLLINNDGLTGEVKLAVVNGKVFSSYNRNLNRS